MSGLIDGINKRPVAKPRQPQKASEYELFIMWTSLPTAYKVPKMQKELALSLGVEEATLSDWKARPDFWIRVRERVQEWAKSKTPEIVDGLFQSAKDPKGSPADRKLWFQLFEDFREGVDISDPISKLLEGYGLINQDGNIILTDDDDVDDDEGVKHDEPDDGETAPPVGSAPQDPA